MYVAHGYVCIWCSSDHTSSFGSYKFIRVVQADSGSTSSFGSYKFIQSSPSTYKSWCCATLQLQRWHPSHILLFVCKPSQAISLVHHESQVLQPTCTSLLLGLVCCCSCEEAGADEVLQPTKPRRLQTLLQLPVAAAVAGYGLANSERSLARLLAETGREMVTGLSETDGPTRTA